MRLWHIDLIPYLPKSQLIAQWRELNSIFKKEDKHILINYIYDYKNKSVLHCYSEKVICEMKSRGINIKSYDNFNNYFKDQKLSFFAPDFNEHDNEYLTICYYNLKEKYLRGQKDFSDEVWKRLDKFYRKEIMKSE